MLEDLPRLGRAATAEKYHVKPTAIDVARRGVDLPQDLRRRKRRDNSAQAAT